MASNAGYLALVKKYGKYRAYKIISRAQKDRARKSGNIVLSVAQEGRERWRAIETEGKKIYGKWY